ncbi:hypothetical protein OUHCRE11_47360 [Enterobacter asburiae]
MDSRLVFLRPLGLRLEVLTNGGIAGIVTDIGDNFITIEVGS